MSQQVKLSAARENLRTRARIAVARGLEHNAKMSSVLWIGHDGMVWPVRASTAGAEDREIRRALRLAARLIRKEGVRK